MPAPAKASTSARDVAGGADADGVAEAELAGAEVEQPLADVDHLVDRHRALPRVAEAHRDVGADVEAGVAGAAYGRLEHRELLVEAAVEVLLGEGLGGAAEDRDVAAARAPGPGRGRARWAPAPAGPRPTSPSTGHQVLGVGELGHPPRVHEAGRLDDRQPGGEQPADELRLDLDGHQRRLVLQAVAGADLVDRHPLGQPVGRDGHRQVSVIGGLDHEQRRPRAPPGRRRAAPTAVDGAGERRLQRRAPSSSPPSCRAPVPPRPRHPRRRRPRARCRASAR